MFTGLIEQPGIVLNNQVTDGIGCLSISASYQQLQLGESFAVNGVCLTLIKSEGSDLYFDVSPETLGITTLGTLVAGDVVNVERAMMASTRFGGHYVSGHVDTMALIHSVQPIGDFVAMELTGFSDKALFYLIPKGSITVDGVSLTINEVANHTIKVMLVPHTLSNTNLGISKVGTHVNIEFDYLTRIVAHQLQLSGKVNYEVAL